jgi:glycosyltransferase involved in cell wall biosynthesis
MSKSRKPEVLLIPDGEIATVYIVEATLKACLPLGLDVRKKLLSSITSADFGPDTIPMFVRCVDPILIPWVKILRRFNRPYFYYVDDLLWKLSGDSSVAHYYRHPLVMASMREGLRGALTVLTNSTFLAKELEAFADRIKVVPAMHDFSATEGVIADANGEVRIGFAGSTSRIDDLAIIEPVVHRLLAAYPNLVLEFAGVWPTSLKASNRVRLFPHVSDFRSFARFQASRGWAVGLAPLRDTPANRCKTDNKYREYGACRIAGVYSDQPPYRGSVRRGETGLLVGNDPEQWFRAVVRLIEYEEERSCIAKAAFEDVWSRYRAEVVTADWAATMLGALQSEPFREITAAIPAHERLMSTLRHWSVQISASHHEGGIPLVLRRSAARAAQAIRRS